MSRKQAVLFVIGLVFVAAVNAAAFSLAGEKRWVVEQEQAGAGVSAIDGNTLLVESGQLSPRLAEAIESAAGGERGSLVRRPTDAKYVVVMDGVYEGVYRVYSETPLPEGTKYILAAIDVVFLAVVTIVVVAWLVDGGVAVFRL